LNDELQRQSGSCHGDARGIGKAKTLNAIQVDCCTGENTDLVLILPLKAGIVAFTSKFEYFAKEARKSGHDLLRFRRHGGIE